MKNKELAHKIIDYRYKSEVEKLENKLTALSSDIDFMLNGKLLKQKTVSQKDVKRMLEYLKGDRLVILKKNNLKKYLKSTCLLKIRPHNEVSS